MDKIRIAIADDHPMIIDGLKNILTENNQYVLIGAYFNGEDLLKGLKKEVPDILFLDIQMPGKGGDEIMPLIMKDHPKIKVIVLTNFDSFIYLNTMISRGASGYLIKTTDKYILFKAIEAVLNGKIFIEDNLRKRMESTPARHNSRGTSKLSLSSREKEILQLIVNGNTNQEIASTIHLSIHTVENYRDSILLKMDVKNTAALVKKALQLGFAH